MSFLRLYPSGTSKDIPKHQRRGAILVLGMLAAAKPEMISEHIDLLLKIGLGPHGKVSMVAMHIHYK